MPPKPVDKTTLAKNQQYKKNVAERDKGGAGASSSLSPPHANKRDVRPIELQIADDPPSARAKAPPSKGKAPPSKGKAPPSKYAALSSRGESGKEESDTDASDNDENDDEDQDVDSTITVQVFLAKKPDVGKGPVFDPNAQCVSVTVKDSVRLHNDPLGEDTFTELILAAVDKAGGRLDHPSTNGDYT